MKRYADDHSIQADGQWVRYEDVEVLFSQLASALGEDPDTAPEDVVAWILHKVKQDDKDLMEVVVVLNEAGVPNLDKHQDLLSLAGRIVALRETLVGKAMKAWDELREEVERRLLEDDD
jgi:hypothetical protein